MSDDTILQTEDLTKDFAGFVAVNGVNLRVRRGTIHALIGPNGAGKTTCFNLLTKFLSPTRGRILFKGDDITDMGSILGAIVTGFGLGVIEGLTKVFFPEASNTVIFVIMAIVLLVRPAGLFGRRA
jgi:ABC-type branched-chain amino acid transport systems, ATPase component